MKRLMLLCSLVLVSLFAGCATTVGECKGASICPIVIYERLGAGFGAYPDRIQVSADSGPSLIWTFADQTKYKFSAVAETVKGDGVELIDANGAVVGLAPCFITTDSKNDFSFAPEGAYYRCEINASMKPNQSYRYRVRFHAMDGTPRVVDPTVDTTGGGDNPVGTARRRAVVPVTISLGSDASVPLPPVGDTVTVVWDAGSGSLFQKLDSVRLTDPVTAADVDIQPCFKSATADGAGPSSTGSGRYYSCVFFTRNNFALKYEASYTDAGGGLAKSSGKINRP